jgi:hypothetical protein
MSRPRTQQIIAALADVQAGRLTAYAAAKKHGVLQSTISRALKPIDLCKCCGQKIRTNPKKIQDCNEIA